MKIDQYDLPLKLLKTQNQQKTTRPKQKSVPLIFEQMTSQPASQPAHLTLVHSFCALAAVLLILMRTSIMSPG